MHRGPGQAQRREPYTTLHHLLRRGPHWKVHRLPLPAARCADTDDVLGKLADQVTAWDPGRKRVLLSRRIGVGNQSMDLIAVRGTSHDECTTHVSKLGFALRRQTLLVSRDHDNTKWARKLGNFLQPLAQPGDEPKITDPSSGMLHLGYGPRTSVIQKRLRGIYGFDDVGIRSHDSKIQVRVRRRGEELRPTDYFSQSQQQTLLLGLFLTACLSQTWSSLSPIFLDDPVTHFDDLNTYAFLDLIVGFVESEPGKRQFVISTCDERFLQLARQKFRRLGNRSAFYKFSAIGADGPVIEQIQAFQEETVTPNA